MASPQLPNGFTQVANEILDHICMYKFNGAQFRIIIKLWRMTYGYKRKEHEFSRSFIQDATGLSESTVKVELATLIKNNVLLVVEKETHTEARKLAFNKNYDEWTIPKCGEPMDKQLDLFTEGEGCYSTPHDESRGVLFHPPEGCYSTPQVITRGGAIPPLYKESLLNKSIKEKESYFEAFYKAYPRKVSKAAAVNAWNRLCKDKDFDPALAIRNTMNFAQTCVELNTEKRYIPHPSTFLNQKRYEDYDVVDPENLTAGKESKFDANLDFLRQQIGGGDDHEQRRGGPAIGEGFGGLLE